MQNVIKIMKEILIIYVIYGLFMIIEYNLFTIFMEKNINDLMTAEEHNYYLEQLVELQLKTSKI